MGLSSKIRSSGLKPVSGKSSSGNTLLNMMMAQNMLAEKIGTQKETELKYLPQEESIKAQAKGQAKMAEEKANVAFGAGKQLTASNRFVQQFERSYDELEKIAPGFSKTGPEGKLKRVGAGIKTFMGLAPETETFSVELEPLANQMARDVEGGRVTDADRKIYWKAFANTLSHPSEANSRLVANSLISLADKGADISKNMLAFSESKNPVMQKVYSYVGEAYPQFSVQSQQPSGLVPQNNQAGSDPLDELRQLYLKR